MLTYSAHAIKGGYAVAYTRPDGHLCAVLDCATREAAQAEADKLNEQQAAQQRAAIHAGRREHAIPERRSVRWFPDDAFA